MKHCLEVDIPDRPLGGQSYVAVWHWLSSPGPAHAADSGDVATSSLPVALAGATERRRSAGSI